MEQRRFETAEEYIRTKHPQYRFVLTIRETANAIWHYTEQEAETLYQEMLAITCEQARKTDLDSGLEIVIGDPVAHGASPG